MKNKDKETIKYLEPYSKKWHKLAYELLLQHHEVDPCENCGHPVLEFVCCTFCRYQNRVYETKTVINKKQ